jgi:GNAT superfamily N-acetyltransferase
MSAMTGEELLDIRKFADDSGGVNIATVRRDGDIAPYQYTRRNRDIAPNLDPRRNGDIVAYAGRARCPSEPIQWDVLPPFDPDDLVRHGADAHRLLIDDAGRVCARCSLWWKPRLHHGERVGVVGHYAAVGAADGAILLDRACAELAAHGCTLAVGPMDGSTWRRYRLVTEGGSEPPFFSEPENPADWPAHFAAAGFFPAATYHSALNDDLEFEDPRIPAAAARLSAMGITLRPMSLERFDDELRLIHALTTVAFQQAPFYARLDEAEFRSLYAPLRPWLRPELVVITELAGRAVGYLFALPDLAQAHRGVAIDTVVLKTLAVLPERDLAGLGSWLVNECHRVARSLGYRRVIHALMHDANASCRISARSARPMRRYTIFGRKLAGAATP